MSAWWLERDGRPPRPPVADGGEPQLLGTIDDLRRELAARRAAFVPEWRGDDRRDAGVAFSELLLGLGEPVLRRLNRLPEKSFVEFLNLAGSSALGPQAASAFIEFTLLESLLESIQIPAGFQLSAPAAGGGDDVFFETDGPLFAVPLALRSFATQLGTRASEFAPPSGDATAVLPFGPRPEPGSGFLLGFEGVAQVRGSLTLLVRVIPRDLSPQPAAAGSVAAPRALPVPTLEWAVLDAGSWVPLELLRDETVSLTRTGLVELKAPERWRPGNPGGVSSDLPLRWLRAQLVNGAYPDPPRIAFVKVNAARASAGRTIRGEILTAVPGSARRRFALSQFPVLPGSLRLEVDEGPSDDVTPDDAGQYFRRWQGVADLSRAEPGERVFALDPDTGTVYFGDDRHGRSVPEGARNVRAVRYRLASGSASAVPAEQIATLVSALPGVTGATNPLPASGGAASETRDAAIRRAPEEIRAQGRAVTAADYALLALGSPGALVARAHAVAAFDARFPGASTPGVVTVFVVTPVRAGQLPIADDEALRSVAAHLSGAVAPLGVEVVAAVPLFQRVGVMAELELDPDADPVESLHAASDRLDAYLHPLTGGDDGRGWPFGGPVRYGALVRAVMDGTSGGHRAVRGVAVLRYSVDGRPVQRCTDHAIAANSLVWPGTHRLSALRSS